MPRPRPEAVLEAARWRLDGAWEVGRSGTGIRPGSGTGASLEFQDRRSYVAGDDVRHVDWRAYGRTDQLLVRQYREEVLPRVDVLVDASRSMALDAAKAQATVELALLLAQAARNVEAEVRVVALGDEPRRLPLEALARDGLALEGRTSLGETLRRAGPVLSRGGLRVLVSDLLVPLDPRELGRLLADGAARVLVVQLLGAGDLAPEGGAVRVEDVERGGRLDLELDDAALARYAARLERLSRGVEEELRRLRGLCLRAIADRPLGALARDVLAPAGVLAPA